MWVNSKGKNLLPQMQIISLGVLPILGRKQEFTKLHAFAFIKVAEKPEDYSYIFILALFDWLFGV